MLYIWLDRNFEPAENYNSLKIRIWTRWKLEFELAENWNKYIRI
jgi:hypothetical protein